MRLRCDRGLASLEYVGLLCLVSVVLAVSGAAVAVPDVAGAVVDALRRGLCRVAGGVCTVQQAREERLDPCLVHVRSDDERVRVGIGVVRLGRDDGLLVERRSDGTARVTFADGWEGGAHAAVGVRFGPLEGGGRSDAGVGVRYAGGAVWTFEDWESARRFVERAKDGEDLRGELRRLVPFGDDGPSLPPPDETYSERGAFAEGTLEGGIPLAGRRAGLDAAARGSAVLGHRRSGTTTTWSLRVGADVVAQLGVVLGAVGAEGRREAVLEYTTDGGRPTTATLRTVTGIAGDVGVFGARTDLRSFARRLRGVGANGAAAVRGGLELDAGVSLDLTDPENLAAVRGVLRAQGVPGAIAAVRTLAGRLDAAGTVEVAVYRTGTRRDGGGLEAGAGATFGGSYDRTAQTRDLLRAWTMRPRGSLREREDCGAG